MAGPVTGSVTYAKGNYTLALAANVTNATIRFGGGTDVLNGVSTDTNDTFIFGAGNNNALTAGDYSTVAMGSGNNEAVTVGAHSQITLGAGNNDVVTAGAGSTITAGAGNNQIVTGATVTLGAGNNDIVHADVGGGGAASFTVLASFNGANGAFPTAGLVADSHGNLFGTTAGDGVNNQGTVFEIAKTATGYGPLITLHSFTGGADGSGSYAGLYLDSNGGLFGTTAGGGAYGLGTVFELANSGSGYAGDRTVLASFNGVDGAFTASGLIADANGNLLGVTQGDDAANFGTVFEIAKTATGYAGAPTVLYAFSGGADGNGPYFATLLDAAGDLIGTTYAGGAFGYGVVFELAKTATGYASTPTVLYSFTGGADGANPSAGLVADTHGNLFGTTDAGGASGNGVVFEIAKTATGYASTPTVLYRFTGGVDGAIPSAPLIVDANGDLFGTTYAGGASGGGAVFEIVKTSTGYASTPTILYSFNGQAEGANPYFSNLYLDANGDLFGTTYAGGASGEGVVFEIKPAGAGGGGAGKVTIGAGNNEMVYLGAGGVATLGAGNNDIVYAGANNTIGLGPSGNNTQIVFNSAAVGSIGSATVTHFAAQNNDVIQLNHALISNFAAVHAVTAQVGSDTVITIDAHDVITLAGVAASSLHAGNFLFV